MMIEYTTSQTDQDLISILELQKENLPMNLATDEISAEGFVTVKHNLSILQKMNSIEQHVIAKDGEKVIAYLLAMTAHLKSEVPVLIPMFEMFDKINLGNKFLSQYSYIVVGQACVAKGYRGAGILDSCYAEYKNRFKNKYDFAITEIDLRNQRSINAHKRIGFREIHSYSTPDKVEWSIVLWKW